MTRLLVLVALAFVFSACETIPNSGYELTYGVHTPLGVTPPITRAASLDSLELTFVKADMGEDHFPIIVRPGDSLLPYRRWCNVSFVAKNISTTQYFEPVWVHSALVLTLSQDSVIGRVYFYPEQSTRLNPGESYNVALYADASKTFVGPNATIAAGDSVILKVILNDELGSRAWLDTPPVAYLVSY
jgi:hypothetical protein